VKRIIDHIADLNIGIVRFTGGEPLLRPDIYELMAYAKNRGLEVRLNTNASLVDKKFADSLEGILDNVLIPVESFSAEEEGRITNFPDSLPRKIKAIQYFYEAGIPVVRVGTVATKRHVADFKKLAEFVLDLPINIWEFYRPISEKKSFTTPPFDRSDIKKLTQSIVKAREETDKDIIIANCLPFCAITSPQILAFISTGALFDEGHSRMVIDPRGFVKPHYFIDYNIGNPLELEAAWNSDIMLQLRKLELLPEQCSDCLYKRKCAGGSRFEAEIANGDKKTPDPLSDFHNKIV
jgi:radical SAM protein with 4Fe4S-binding SPASM domain